MLTEEEKEDLVYSLWAEWRDIIGAAANDEKKYAFIVGARAAIHALEQQACSLCGLRPEPKDPCADTACPAGRS